MAYKRADWNGLIDEVNQVLQNPPSGCDAIPPIEHVPTEHRWSKSDIREMQNKIKQTCDDITFNEIDPLWKQSTLDEINEKLAEAWCDCDCSCPENNIGQPGPAGSREIVICTYECRVSSNCFGDFDNVVPACSIVQGMQVGVPGLSGRRWQLLVKRVNNTYLNPIVQGLVGCDGKVICTSPLNFNFICRTGIHVFCGDCESEGCDNALANAEANIDNTCAITTLPKELILRVICNDAQVQCCSP